MKKIVYFIFVLTVSAVLLTACSASGAKQNQQAASAVSTVTTSAQKTAEGTGNNASEKVFTKDELSKYNGQNGNPAYIAVNGVVYDVTNVRQWRNGSHHGYQAGVDLTEAFKTASPHDSSIFNGIPIVGRYAG